MAQDALFQKALGLVARWAALHPELKDRLERAVFLLENVQASNHPDIYLVRSSSGRGRYTVRVDRQAKTSTCNCQDSANGHWCKHRLATALYEKARG
jgi:hypothetical protein